MTQFNIINIDETDSTNNEVKKLAAKGFPHGTVVRAERQTAGKGRSGKSWSSVDGGLFFSVLLRPPAEMAVNPGMITLSAGIAAAETARSFGVKAGVKWPNDVLAGGRKPYRKFCGILAETSAEDGVSGPVVLGIGVNVNIKKFPTDIAGIATSMYLETGGAFDSVLIMESILQAFTPLYYKALDGDSALIIARYKQLCLNIGEVVTLTNTVTGERITGLVLDVDGGGGLVMRLEYGSVYTAWSGEVTFNEKL
ncbi:MAG: biotin--[acetyl-CoA-carboxylase] ligase [Clostridiales bacterium]|jgi:BirA family biotin operon repressor/biotin-[acetyl-CoA-carboxylase] ligase|nr:biotin--[acetyl-CoA-carboxylase] ligase [Clostridiales bacterium]